MKKNSTFILRLPDQTRDKLHAHAQAAGITLSEMIRSLAERELSQAALIEKRVHRECPDILGTGTAQEICDHLFPKALDMWELRAKSMATVIIEALCELRDHQGLALSIDLILDHLHPGLELQGSDKIGKGLVGLYLQSLEGDLSTETGLRLLGFLQTIPGFDLDAILAGQEHHERMVRHAGLLAETLCSAIKANSEGNPALP